MNIAMFTNNYKPFVGGVPISIERLTDGLRKLGHNVYIFAPTYPNQIKEENVFRFKSHKSMVLDAKAPIPYTYDPEIEKEFKKLHIDVIHTHHPVICGWTALHFGKKYNIPVLFTYHTKYEEYIHNVKFLNYLINKSKHTKNKSFNLSEVSLNLVKNHIIPGQVKYFSNKCDMVIAPTQTIKQDLERTGIKTKISVIPTGISPVFFEEVGEDAREIRSEYKGDKKFLFCSVSRISKEKNIDFIIDGIYNLKNEVGDCFKLMLIGDGPDIEKYQLKAKNRGVDKNVVFVGNIPNEIIADYYKASDLFLFASKSETQGIVLLEAMSSKTPIVAVKASGVQDVVVNGENGFMTEDDVSQWVESIKSIMKDESLYKKLQDGAYKTAQNFSTHNIALKAQEAYNDSIVIHKCCK